MTYEKLHLKHTPGLDEHGRQLPDDSRAFACWDGSTLRWRNSDGRTGSESLPGSTPEIALRFARECFGADVEFNDDSRV